MCLTWNGKSTCTNKSWLCDSNLWLVLTNDLTHNSPRDFNKLFHEQLPMVFKVAGSKAPLHAKRMAVKGLKGSGKLPVSSSSVKLPQAIMYSLSNNAIKLHIAIIKIFFAIFWFLSDLLTDKWLSENYAGLQAWRAAATIPQICIQSSQTPTVEHEILQCE